MTHGVQRFGSGADMKDAIARLHREVEPARIANVPRA